MINYDPKPRSGQRWRRIKDGTIVRLNYADTSSGARWTDYVTWEAVETHKKGDCYVASLLKNYELLPA